MIDLMGLEPQQISKNLKGKFVLIYGQEGCGKTTLASKFNKSLMCGFERGTNALHNVYVQPIKAWTEWKTVVSQLCRKPELKEKYETICIDTVDEAWKLCVRYICANNEIEDLSELPYGKAYDLATNEFSKTLRDLAYSGYGIVYITHAVEKTYEDDDGDEYAKIQPSLPPRPFAVVNKMVDIITYIREIYVGEEKKPERYMFFRGDNRRFLVKSRYKHIEPKSKLSYEDFVDIVYKAIEKEIEEKGGVATEKEDPYLSRNFDELMEEARILWNLAVQKDQVDEVVKILEEEFKRPIKFSEILSTQVDELFNSIERIREFIQK